MGRFSPGGVLRRELDDRRPEQALRLEPAGGRRTRRIWLCLKPETSNRSSVDPPAASDVSATT